MANLASSADVADRLGRTLESGEAARIEALLADASAAVRVYTGQSFTLEERTVRVRARTNVVRLTERPVTEVASVTDIDGNDVSYRWDGLDEVYLWPLASVRFDLDWPTCWPVVVDVTYTAGPECVPAAI